MTPADGYAEALALHERRLHQGWRPVGRKIGFTNRGIWPLYGVYQPIWGTVYDRTLIMARDQSAAIALDGLSQPRIEPEICFSSKTLDRRKRLARPADRRHAGSSVGAARPRRSASRAGPPRSSYV